jgi:uncharacterized membrane protein YfcA
LKVNEGKNITILDYIIATSAAILAGFINALAGGGTLITFPVLVALGMPSISANITNTIALCPGYLGGTLAQSTDLKDQKKRLLGLLPAGIMGGILGGILLLLTGEKLFTELIPFLILTAATLLAIQNPLRKLLNSQNKSQEIKDTLFFSFIFVFFAAVYGGYFGAGLSVILLAVLSLVLKDNLIRLNALKQAIAFVANIAAALFFCFSGQVYWIVALFMAIGALLGGALGGKCANKVKPSLLKLLVVVVGYIIGIIYLIRNIILN